MTREEMANPITGQPYDALTPKEYEQIRRRHQSSALPRPDKCFDCDKKIDDGWSVMREGKYEFICRGCKFPDAARSDGDA